MRQNSWFKANRGSRFFTVWLLGQLTLCSVFHAQSQTGPFLFLTPPDASEYGGTPAPDGGVSTGDRGAFITALDTFSINSLGVEADLTSSSLTLIAKIYEASGLARGALLASSSMTFADSGTAFYDIPIDFTFTGGRNYDITIDFLPAPDLEIRFFNFDPAMFGNPPFEVGGLILVRDGEQQGEAGNYVLPHLRVGLVNPEGPPVISAHPQSRTAIAGTSVTFSVSAFGTPPLSYQWRKDGTNISGATTNTYRIVGVQTNDAGTYSVVVSNAFDSVTSSNATLSVIASTGVRVLLIWDVLNANTLALKTTIEAVGFSVTLSTTSETLYDGTNPSPDGFNAVIHLNGTTYDQDMPLAGQNALVNFVQNGGGYLHSEWDAYELSNGIMLNMRDLILLDRSSGNNGSVTVSVIPGQSGHPVVANVPSSFTFLAGYNVGSAHVFAVDPVTVLMRDSQANDAVAVRQFGAGRIVGFHHAGNWEAGTLVFNTLADPNVQQLYVGGVFWAAGVPPTNQPPVVTVQPQSQAVVLGGMATLTVSAFGTPPLSYQWRKDGTNISGATTNTYRIVGVQTNDAGSYSVVVSNAYGLVTSSNAVLTVVSLGGPGDEFQIVSLTSDASFVIDHDALTGDDRGGIAASATQVFYSGDNATARFKLVDLSGGASLGVVRDAMVSDLRTETVYSLGNGATPLDSGGGTVTTLLEMDGNTGAFTGRSVSLSTPITMNYNSGIFAGYGRIMLHNGSRVFNIALPSGVVVDLGPMTMPPHMGAENWAFWGVAEFFGGSIYLAYVQDYQTVVRTRVPDGLTTPLANFSNLSDMACITVSIPLNRWYFHHEGSSQFGGSSETLGYATAFFNVVSTNPPLIVLQPQSLTAALGSTASFSVGAAGGTPLSYQWRKDGTNISGATTNTYRIVGVQTNDAGSYSVVVSNAYGSVTSSNAVLIIGTPCQSGLGAMVFTTGADVQVRIIRGNVGAAYTSDLYIAIPGREPVYCGSSRDYDRITDIRNLPGGSELLFYIYVRNTGYTFYIGPGSRNPDGVAHANIRCGANGTAIIGFEDLFGGGDFSYNDVYFQLHALPTIISQPASQTVTVNSNATFTVAAAGTPPLRYQWRFNGTNIADATNTSLTLANVQISNAGGYSVQVINAYGSVISSNALLTINRFPLANPQSITLDEDTATAVALTGTDPDGDPLTYMAVSGPTNGTLSGPPPNLTYTPNANYFGPDSFTFKVNDGQVDSAVATVSFNVISVNDAPVARASVSPLAQFPGNTNLIAISLNNSNAEVVLDGSQSTDVENDPLQYSWLEGTNIIATGVLATNVLEVGTHTITLAVSDGMDMGMDTVVVEVITPAQSVGILIAMVDQANLLRKNQRPLIATLKAAAASLNFGNLHAGIRQLEAFQLQVTAQIAPLDPALAESLINAAQIIIDTLSNSP